MQNLLYIANLRLPTEKAYGIQIAKMCETFAEQGVSVKLVIPARNNPIGKDIFDYYGVKRNFGVIRLFSPDFYLSGKIDKLAVIFKSFLSSNILFLYALFQKPDIIYSRDELTLFLLSFFRRNLVFESHKFSNKKRLFYRRFKKARVKIVTISKGIKDEFIYLGFKPEMVLVAHDGVDIKQFAINKTTAECRELLGLPKDKMIVLYSGHLYKWKGANVLLEAARNFQFSIFNLPKNKENVLFVFVGGTGPDIEDLKKSVETIKIQNVMIVGYVSHDKVPLYLKAADILVLPNSGKNEVSRLYTSPMKMFEYMASSKPIIASDLPSIREVLNEDTAFFFRPDDPESLTKEISQVINNNSETDKRSANALKEAVKYSWSARSYKIIQFIK